MCFYVCLCVCVINTPRRHPSHTPSSPLGLPPLPSLLWFLLIGDRGGNYKEGWSLAEEEEEEGEADWEVGGQGEGRGKKQGAELR